MLPNTRVFAYRIRRVLRWLRDILGYSFLNSNIVTGGESSGYMILEIGKERASAWSEMCRACSDSLRRKHKRPGARVETSTRRRPRN